MHREWWLAERRHISCMLDRHLTADSVLYMILIHTMQIALPLAMGTAGLAAGQWGAGAMVGHGLL